MRTGKKAVFVDKDGTLIPDIPYNVDTRLIQLEKGVPAALRALQNAGYLIVIISNQAGMAHGYFDAAQLQKVIHTIQELLIANEVVMHGFYYCPHHPQGSVQSLSVACDCRKPKPGLLLTAARELDIDLTRSWMIGDILDDVEAGNAAGCRSILIDNGNETEWVLSAERTPTAIAPDFKTAAQYVLEQSLTLSYDRVGKM